MTLRAGAASNIGEIHLELAQPNQDNYICNIEQKIFAVFDGHGDQGHVIAGYLKDHLATTFTSSLSPTLSVEDSLKNLFKTINDNICKDDNSASSGSTCVMTYIDNNNLYVAGVGDCSALLVKTNSSSGKIETTSLFTWHKITNEEERNRIVQTGASINGEYIVSKLDPNKVINMTRAFGDQDMQSSGIIALPEISLTNLSPNEEADRVTKKPKIDANSEIMNDDEKKKTTSGEDGKQGEASSNGSDTFLLLFSDGLDQVQGIDDIARKAHHLIRKNLGEKKEEQVPLSTLCTILLQKLEDMVVERDGAGFSDDATVVMVLLDGF